MSTFIITIEDNAKGVCIKAHDMRHPDDGQTVAYGMGSFLIDTLNQYLAAHGVPGVQVHAPHSHTQH
ncbi:hypothetical protein ACH5Y9_05420 [Methylomonas sp. BW4-1]|uniref:hypothetical protein n=1 Tax=Methylomonas sp. BW4-1 TaxID=3376685 RepID=UPI004040FF69